MTERKIRCWPYGWAELTTVEYEGEYKPIYVGQITEQDLATGEAQRKLAVAERAREIAAKAVYEGPLAQRILTLTAKIDPSPIADEQLTTDQKNRIAETIANLVDIYEKKLVL